MPQSNSQKLRLRRLRAKIHNIQTRIPIPYIHICFRLHPKPHCPNCLLEYPKDNIIRELEDNMDGDVKWLGERQKECVEGYERIVALASTAAVPGTQKAACCRIAELCAWRARIWSEALAAGPVALGGVGVCEDGELEIEIEGKLEGEKEGEGGGEESGAFEQGAESELAVVGVENRCDLWENS
jgi:hypothetical protein